jgi:hypothetical protein
MDNDTFYLRRDNVKKTLMLKKVLFMELGKLDEKPPMKHSASS